MCISFVIINSLHYQEDGKSRAIFEHYQEDGKSRAHVKSRVMLCQPNFLGTTIIEQLLCYIIHNEKLTLQRTPK
jgi:hypothetical protein